MDGHHSMEDKLVLMEKFIQKMEDSGYSHQGRVEIMESAVKKY